MPNIVNKVTNSTINDLIHTVLHRHISLQSVILQYRFAITSCLADLSCFYKRNLLDVKGSLMSAIWLQSNPNDKYPFLEPTSKAKLRILIIRSANFGFKDRTALANMTNVHGQFYNEHFPKFFISSVRLR